MKKGEWQPLPGTLDAHAYPYIRRPDVLSCNSYLIDCATLMILIDPGALPRQTRELRSLLDERDRGRNVPRMVFLTHCHYDHSREAGGHLGGDTPPAWLAVQEHGARALADGDSRRTAADLYGEAIAPIDAHLALLGAEDLRAKREHILDLPGIRVVLRPELLDPSEPGDPRSYRQVLEFDRGRMEIYPCPGHSPDSVCYRMGEWLFIGDLLVANRPLVAGVCGWDACHLVQSMERMIALLESEQISWCCPAHGDPLPAAKALDLLRRQRGKALRPGEIREMNPHRLFQAVDMAREVVDEAEEVFSSMAGRLLYVADRMEMLEENDTAGRCRAAMDMAAVDNLIEVFRRQSRALEAGEVLPVSFAIEATGIVEKLRQHLSSDLMHAILPVSLLHRAQRLLLDFLGIANGFRNPEEFVPVDPAALLADLERTWQASPHREDRLAQAVDDPEQFAAELARRIGHPPLARRVPVHFLAASAPEMIHAAAVRWVDTMIHFLEWLGLAGAEAITVEGLPDGAFAIRTIAMNPDGSGHQEKKRQSFTRRFALAGFLLICGPDGMYRLLPNESGESGKDEPCT